MKTKLVVLGALIAFTFGCKKQKENVVSTTCEENLEEIRTLTEFLHPTPDDLDDQEHIPMEDYPTPEDFKGLFDVSGNFEIKKNTIKVNIPVPSKKLKIVNYENLSSSETNAMLIVLDGNNGNRTGHLPNKSVITKQFKINKVGLDTTLLRQHGKLTVIVLHDDNFNTGHVEFFKRCIKDNPGYNKNCIDTSFVNFKKVIFKPNELGGDFIP